MKIFKALDSGCRRSLKVWKAILIIWFVSLLLASLVALPMRSAMKTGFGQSTITEKLSGGINIEVISDLGAGFRSLTHFFSSALMLLILLWLLINAFLTGGLFDSLKGSANKFLPAEFFRACAKNFLSFLVITLSIGGILLFLSVILIAVPSSGFMSNGSGPEWVPYLIEMISILVFLLISLIFFLVADYARAWQVKNEKSSAFKAIGFGFSTTFRNFLSSWPMMFMLCVVQAIFLFMVFMIVGQWKPATGAGVFLFFILSQALFFIRLSLKAWRYGSVTSMKEFFDSSAAENQPFL